MFRSSRGSGNLFWTILDRFDASKVLVSSVDNLLKEA